jgi:hypothetical protein
MDDAPVLYKNSQPFFKNKLIFIFPGGNIAWEHMKATLVPGLEDKITIPGDGILKTQVWKWLTNMPSIYKAEIVYKFGHGRWEVEDRGFHDLATNCRLDHPFHHDPTALLAMIWIISIAFNLSYAFYQ